MKKPIFIEPKSLLTCLVLVLISTAGQAQTPVELNSIRSTTNVNNSLRQAFLDNNTYAWTPKAPVKMFHCRGDRDVIFASTNGQRLDSLVQRSDGNFYGVSSPPPTTGPPGYGDVLKITAAGVVTLLGPLDGGYFYGEHGLMQRSDDNLYFFSWQGAVLKIVLDGTVTSLASFNGAYPNSLIQGSDGNLYGTTSDLGPNGGGMVFGIRMDGTVTQVYPFNAPQRYLISGLMQGSDGNLYGIDNSSSGGAIFRLVPPPVLNTTPPANGKMTLSWNSFPGGTYRVEYKSTLTDTNWIFLNPDLTAAGDTASVTDNFGSASESYYRIRLLP